MLLSVCSNLNIVQIVWANNATQLNMWQQHECNWLTNSGLIYPCKQCPLRVTMQVGWDSPVCCCNHYNVVHICWFHYACLLSQQMIVD